MSIFSNSSMSHSIIDNTMIELQNQSIKHSHILQNVMQQYSTKLQNLQFNQNHLQSKMVEIQKNHQIKYMKYIKEQEQLNQIMQKKSQYITLRDLRVALGKQGQWGKAVGYFLNPQAAFNSYLTKLQMEIPQLYTTINQFNTQQHLLKQSLLKHSEKKLITLQKMIEIEDEVIRLDEIYLMTIEDIQGRGEQIYSLIFEYEDLEQISQQIDQNLIHSQSNTVLIKKTLLENENKHKLQNNQKQIKEKQLSQIHKQIDGIRERIRSLKQENDLYPQELSLLIRNPEFLILQQLFSPSQTYKMINQDIKSDNKINITTCIVATEQYVNTIQETQLLVIRIIKLLNEREPIQKKQLLSLIDPIIFHLNRNENHLKQFDQLFKFLNQFKNPQTYLALTQMSPQSQQKVYSFLTDQFTFFAKRFNILKQLFLQSNELDQLNKVQHQIEKDVQKLIYDQIMTQQCCQKYSLQLKELNFTEQQFKLPPEYTQISIVIERMSVIEQRRIENQFTIDQHKEVMTQIISNKQIIKLNLKQFIQELFYIIEIENAQLLKMQQLLNSSIKESMQNIPLRFRPQFQSPQLIVKNNNREEDHEIKFYEEQVQENRYNWNTFEHEQLKIMQVLEEQLNTIEHESSSYTFYSLQELIRDKILQTQCVLGEQKCSPLDSTQLNVDISAITNVSNYNHEIHNKLDMTAQAIENKENYLQYNLLHQRSQSALTKSNMNGGISFNNLQTKHQQTSTTNNKKQTNYSQINQSKIKTNDKTNTSFQPNWNNSTKDKVKNKILKSRPQILPNELLKNITPIKINLVKSPQRTPLLKNKSLNMSQHTRSQSSIGFRQPVSPQQRVVKKTKLMLIPSKQNYSQVIDNLQQISPPQQENSKLYGYYESYRSGKKFEMESIDNVSNIEGQQSFLKGSNQSYGDITRALMGNMEEYNHNEPSGRDNTMFFSFKSPKAENQPQMIKVYKKQIISKSVRRPSLTGPPESSNYFMRYLKINQNNQSIDLYKESQQLDLQILKLEVKGLQNLGLIKLDPPFYVLLVSLQKSQKYEILFKQQKDLELIQNFLQ